MGDMASVGIPREDSQNQQQVANICKNYCKTTARALPTINQVWSTYPTKDLQPATDLMGLEDDIPDTPEARQTTLRLATLLTRHLPPLGFLSHPMCLQKVLLKSPLPMI